MSDVNVEEINFISSKINGINNMKIFEDVLNGIPSQNANNQDRKPKNFLEEIDDRMHRLEKIKDNLKGDAFYLENRRRKVDLKKTGSPTKSIKKGVKHDIKKVTLIKSKQNLPENKVQENNKFIINKGKTVQLPNNMSIFDKSPLKVKSTLKSYDMTTNAFSIKKVKSESIEGDRMNRKKKEVNFITSVKNEEDEGKNADPDESLISENKTESVSTTSRKKHSRVFSDSLLSDTLFSKFKLDNPSGEMNNINPQRFSNISISSPLNQIHHSELNKVLYEKETDHHNRRRGVVLDPKDMDLFVKAVVQKAEKRMNYRYSLIPKPKIDKFIKQGTSLNKVYSKCIKEMEVASEMDKLILKEKFKKISNSKQEYEKLIRQLQIEQDNFILDSDDKPKEEKVFIYNQGQGGFVNAVGKNKSEIDLVTKISERLAYLNRNFFMHDFGFNFSKEPDFIFQEELKKMQKDKELQKLLNEKKRKMERDKHSVVEDYLERTYKGREVLMSKIDNDIYKINKNKDGNYHIDENYHINFLAAIDGEKARSKSKKKSVRKSVSPKNKNKVPEGNNSISHLNRTKSMMDLSSFLPSIIKHQ